MRHARRVKELRNYLARKTLDGFLVSSEVNVAYLSGFPGTDSIIIITPARNLLVTDFRYKEESQGLSDFEIVMRKNGLEGVIADIVRKEKLKRLGFESESLSFKNCSDLHYALKGTKLVPCEGVVEQMRLLKDEDEIALLRKSVSVAVTAVERAKNVLKAGITEIKFANKIESIMREQGAKAAFDLIVASGPNSSRPHARPANRRIGQGEAIVVDIGANFRGYNSDLTRTLFLGKISSYIGRAYRIVTEAQRLAISKVRPGVRISGVDLAARQYITKFGFGESFGHATGHGIGLQVHENPRIWRNSSLRLKKGMVFTVEPAIYVPGKFGIRIEDMVLVTSDGCEVLTDDIDK